MIFSSSFHKEQHIKRLSLLIICFFSCIFVLFAEEGMAFYVDAANARRTQNGTAQQPFTSLEQALTAAYRQAYRQKKEDMLPVTIYVRSDLSIEEALFLTIPVKIKGIGMPQLSFGDNAGFVIEQTLFEITGCSLKRVERLTEPRMVPVLYGSLSTIVLNNVSVRTEEGGEAVIIRAGRFFCTDSFFSSKQSAHALLIRADTAFVSAIRSSFIAEGFNALCFELSGSECVLQETQCSLLPQYTGRAAELVQSSLAAKTFTSSYASPLFERMDAAVLADKNSTVTLTDEPVLHGFSQPFIQRK